MPLAEARGVKEELVGGALVAAQKPGHAFVQLTVDSTDNGSPWEIRQPVTAQRVDDAIVGVCAKEPNVIAHQPPDQSEAAGRRSA